MNDDLRLIKLQEVKDWLKIGTTYVYELIKQGKLPKPLKQGKAVKRTAKLVSRKCN